MGCKAVTSIEEREFEHLYFKMNYFEINFEGGSLNYVNTNRLSKKRVDTLFTKEPTTIHWMDAIKPGEILFDVGGNVGMYSVYAGKMRGARVYAFEPESQNYAELYRNIFLNDLAKTVTAYNVAISDQFEIATLLLSHFCPGFSHHDFGENHWPKDKQLGDNLFVKRDERMEQGCISLCLDEVVRQGVFPKPNHIKVDVDGIEGKVVAGMRNILESDTLQTVLIETDNTIPASVEIIDIMTNMGWKYSYDQMRVNQHEVVSEQDVKDKISAGMGGQNIIYFKDDSYFDYFRNYAETFIPPNPLKTASA